ncbi:MAG TPA: hypothetical protein VFH48_21650 [Chloroflexota bacterium]|nr:hypothetical protein [Chloroflexota bacterium]
MSESALLKASGAAAVAAGVLLALSFLLRPGEQDPVILARAPTTVAHSLGIVGLVLCQLGLIGIYARMRAESGWLGFVGFLVAFSGSNFMTGVWFFSAYVEHVIGAEAPALLAPDGPIESGIAQSMFAVSLVTFCLGHVLFGVSSAIARVFPVWAGALLTIGALLIFVGIAGEILIVRQIGAVLLGLALGRLGWQVWSEHGSEERRRA